jgi:hypothetical protein
MLRRSMNAGVANLIYRLQDAEDDQQDSVHPTRESSREAATIFDRIAMSPKIMHRLGPRIEVLPGYRTSSLFPLGVLIAD